LKEQYQIIKMKKVLLIVMVVSAALFSCGPTTGESGANDDGIKAVDSNGALQDSSKMTPNPTTDTALGEDRVDIQQRDSIKK